MKTVSGAVAAALMICAVLPAHADGLGDHLTFSGFGTIGALKTDTDEARYGRDRQLGGANTNINIGVDSNLGLQLSARANDWLSATVQILGVKRDDDEIKFEPEWAFVKVQPLEGLTVRGGRMALPTFVVSDSRNVGYANTWLRAPNEVYGLAMLRRMDGADVTYSHALGPVKLAVTALAGDSEMRALGTDFDANKVRGLNLQVETRWATFRAGKMISDVNVGDDNPKERYSFTGFGVTVDQGNIVAQAEYVQRRADFYYNLVASDAWYTMAGYRFGAFTPYAFYASTKPQSSDDHLPLNLPAYGGTPLISYQQKTLAMGVRWDVVTSAAVKFQFDRVDTNGSPGISFSDPSVSVPALRFAVPVSQKVNVISASVDFVF